METLNYIYNYVRHKNKLYFVPGYYPVLMSFDLDKRIIGFECDIYMDITPLCTAVFPWKDDILIVNMFSMEISIYDVDTGIIKSYSKINSKGQMCRNVFLRNGKIWFFPYEITGKIVSFDIKSKQYSTALEISSMESVRGLNYCFLFAFAFGDSVILNDRFCDEHFRYSYDKNTLSKVSNPFQENIFSSSAVGNTLYFTASDKPQLFELDILSQRCDRFLYMDGSGRFGKPAVCSGGLLLFCENQMVYFKKGVFSHIECPREVMAENTWSRCSFSYENIVVLMPWTSKYIIIVDLSTEAVVDCIKAEFPADYYRNKNGGYLFEGERDIKLEDYLETICCNAI